MPALADVDCRVYVAQVMRSAVGAIPLPLIQACLAFRPGNASALVAGLGGETFIDNSEQYLMPNGLVLKHRSEGRPASIQDGFRHLGLCQTGGIHVADEYGAVLPNKARGKLVQVIFATVRDLGV